jgi:hypothetical protein
VTFRTLRRPRNCGGAPSSGAGIAVLSALEVFAGPVRSGLMSQNGMDRPCSRPEPLRECAGGLEAYQTPIEHLAKMAIRPIAHSQALELLSEQTEMTLERSFRYGEPDEDDRRSS